MRVLLLPGLALILALVHPAAEDSPAGHDGPASARCSLSPDLTYRSVDTSLLLATATPDTIEAGPGPVTNSTGAGHSGAGGSGPIYGQVIHVARVGGAGGERVERALTRRGDSRVAVVPWDYDPSCRPTRWSQGFAWVPSSDTATYRLKLRPDSMWLDGMPVFDVHAAQFDPYPLGAWFTEANVARESPPAGPWLSATEYFELLLGSPAIEQVRAEPAAVWRRFQEWKRSNAHLLERYPGTKLEEAVAWRVGRVRIDSLYRSIEPVVAGTWRLTFSLHRPDPDAQVAAVPPGERSFYARTRDRPVEPWTPGEAAPVFDDDPLAPVPRPDAYIIYANSAATEAELPERCEYGFPVLPGAHMYVIDPPPHSDRSSWAGWIEPGMVEREFRDYPGMTDFYRTAIGEWGARRVPGVREAPATFTLGEDGVLRVEQVTRTADGRELRLRGERISRAIVDC